MDETRTAVVTGQTVPGVDWGPVFAGTFVASAVALVFHGFAAALGISVSSSAPTWRDASLALVLASGLYLLVVGFFSYGLGAYVTSRLRPRTNVSDTSYSDGMHGLLTWALATVLTALLAASLAAGAARLAAPSATSAGAAQSVAGENIIAFDLDRLFRGRPLQGDVTYTRAEAARILLTTSSHRGMLDQDRAYLVRLVSANTGLGAPEAERRVTEVSASAKANLARARHSAAIFAFMAAAVALLGAAVAWFAAIEAGRHREGLDPVPTLFEWEKPYRWS